MTAANSTPGSFGFSRQSEEASKIEARVKLMQASPLFNRLSKEQCEKVLAYSRGRTFARDELIYIQGQPLRHVTLINSGNVKITQLSPSGDEVLLWIYGPGSVIGVLSEPTGRCHDCSARVMDACTALVWDYERLRNLIAEHPQIAASISQILLTRLNELEERFREVATERVAKRLSSALVRLSRQIGRKVDGGIEVLLSREELAQMTGTTVFTSSRILSRWGNAGFLLPRRESVIVRDVRRLELAGDEDK
jgi:CRP/FNR family transcriptional regulator, nitrogen oxide reductase regulator